MNEFFALFTTGPAYDVLRIVGKAWFLWLPLSLLLILWDVWVIYVRTRYNSYQRWVMLEIKLPQEIAKSPRAIEVVFNSLHNTRKGNLIEQFWEGFLSAWYSFEIAGINGEVHFFVYTSRFFQNLIESQIYAQYPNVEIVEVDDYTKFTTDALPGEKWNVWGAEYSLTKEDSYPIRTYIDMKLEDITKEEEKADPLSSLMEFFGSLRQGEQVWLQIIIQGAGNDWRKDGEKLLEKLLGKKKFETPKEMEKSKMFFLSPGESETVKAIERNISKIGFQTGIRFVYLARRDVYTAATFASFLGIMKQFNSLNLNGFVPSYSTSVDYFFTNRREFRRQKNLIDYFRKRTMFYPPYGSFLRKHESPLGRPKPFILNSEELATIFHFPGRTAETPTLKRLEAQKGGPPLNLPV